MKHVLPICAIALLTISAAGCARVGHVFKARPGANPVSEGESGTRPRARTDGGGAAVAPPKDAQTVEEFDTTTAAEREEAAEVVETGGETALGTTVASLGDPAKPGFWLETPLVSSAAQGRVEFAATGKSAQVELIPIEGPATAGSRISLAAMRLIGAPLTGLPEILVFKK